MIIEFRFSNFLSYKEETIINFTPVKSFKELTKSNIIETSKDFNLLKTTAIYGSNAGGKTNFVEAMGFMTDIIHNSFAESLKKEEERGRQDYYFKLSTTTINKPTSFEVSFIIDNIIYRYGFKILGFKIISEWLYKKLDAETMLFERANQEFKINNKGFPEGNKYKNDVNANVLFLSHLAQNNAKESSNIFHWFADLNVISGLEDKYHKNATLTLLNKSTKFKAWLNLAVKFLEISNIESSKDDKLIAYHNKYDENNIIIDSTSFDFEKDESAGTKKLIYLLGAIYDTLKFGKILFIDELDAKLHPNVSKRLLDLFHKFNCNKAQFVFTAHDAFLMDKEIFRRDQIWFVDKNKFGSSELYSMSDFDASVVRNTSDFKKKYLSSSFGAAESIEISNNLIDFIYEKK